MFISPTLVLATVYASDTVNTGTVTVTIQNPGPGDGTATPPLPFTIRQAIGGIFMPLTLR